jgi:xanthine dehydrogenase YagS FAD-binding subunit
MADGARAVAGGTISSSGLGRARRLPERLVAIHRLGQLRRSPDRPGLRAGALTTHADLAADPRYVAG